MPLFQETDLDSNPPTEGTWDYDHMDVSVTAENEENISSKNQKTSKSNTNEEHSHPSTILPKQTSEDREVAEFTGQNADLLNAPPIFSDSTSESGESNNKFPGEELKEEPPTNRWS